MFPGLGPDEDNADSDPNSINDPEWSPAHHDIHEVEEDDDNDGENSSPKILSGTPSERYMARESARSDRLKRREAKQQSIKESIKVHQAKMARKSGGSTSKIMSPPPDSQRMTSALHPGSGDDTSPLPTLLKKPIKTKKQKQS